jgi:hypothetical protein
MFVLLEVELRVGHIVLFHKKFTPPVQWKQKLGLQDHGLVYSLACTFLYCALFNSRQHQIMMAQQYMGQCNI